MRILEEIKKPNVRGFLIRLILFAVLYAVIFKSHPNLTMYLYGYKHKMIEPYSFYVVFPILGLFAVLKWKQLREEKPYKNSFLQTVIFLILACGVFLINLKGLLVFTEEIIPNSVIYFFPLYLGLSFVFLAIFNLQFVKKYKDELFLVVYLVFLYLSTHVLLENTWYYFSSVILYSLSSILPIFSDAVSVDTSQLMIGMENFKVNVGATCSGIYSIMTFAFLYVASITMIKKKNQINWTKGIFGFLLGIVALFILNIIRIAIIIAVGAFYSPELAIDLFHEYLSAIFLIALFLGYLYFVFPRIIKPASSET